MYSTNHIVNYDTRKIESKNCIIREIFYINLIQKKKKKINTILIDLKYRNTHTLV